MSVLDPQQSQVLIFVFSATKKDVSDFARAGIELVTEVAWFGTSSLDVGVYLLIMQVGGLYGHDQVLKLNRDPLW